MVVHHSGKRLKGVHLVGTESLDEGKHHTRHDGRFGEDRRPVRQRGTHALQAQKESAVADGKPLGKIRHCRVNPFRRQRLVRVLVVGQAQELTPSQQAILRREFSVGVQQVAQFGDVSLGGICVWIIQKITARHREVRAAANAEQPSRRRASIRGVPRPACAFVPVEDPAAVFAPSQAWAQRCHPPWTPRSTEGTPHPGAPSMVHSSSAQ